MANKKPFKNIKPRNNKKSKPAGISEKVIRLLDIYTLIAQGCYPSVDYLSDRFDASKRSIYRYLEIINFIDPIEFDKERKGFRFVNSDRIKKLTLSEDQLLMLLVMGETVSRLGVQFKENFHTLVSNLLNVAKIPSDRNQIPIAIKIPDAVETEKTKEYFETIARCIKEKRAVEIVYKAFHAKEATERRVDPYGLVFYEGAWILIGYCHLREMIRHFALDRIADLKEQLYHFKPLEDFDIGNHLSGSWGVYDEEAVRITVRFLPEVAEYILRKDSWHPSEKRKILQSGHVELSFTVAGINEIKGWLYSWMPYVEVIKPKWFREAVKKDFSKAIKKHS